MISTIAYAKVRPMSRNMAMSIGKEYRPDYVRARHLDILLTDAGLGAAAARRRLRTLADDAPSAVRAAKDELTALGWDAPVLGRIVEIVDRRAHLLGEIAVLQQTGRRPTTGA